MNRWVALVVGALGLACAGIPTETPPAPVPEEPAPAPVAPVEPADDDGEAGHSLLPRLVRETDPRPSDCTLDVAHLEPQLEKVQPGATQPAKMRREANRLVEKVKFDDGTELRIVRGGCAHIGETWEVAPVHGDGDLVEVALAALGKAKTKDKPTWDGIVEKGAKLGEDGSLPCGDATCALKLDGEVLIFSYDFAL